MDAFKWNRKKATIITSLASLIIGIPLTVNMAWFTQWMTLTSAVLMPIGTLIVMIAFFWVYGSSRARKEVNEGASTQMGPWWEFFGKYVAVGGTLFILISGILRFTGIWK